jgi:hypothetical protein
MIFWLVLKVEIISYIECYIILMDLGLGFWGLFFFTYNTYFFSTKKIYK